MSNGKLIEAMMRPEFYPQPTGKVELLQTHISYIFIAGDFVYKVKKPFDLGFLDFTTLERRKHYCFEELRLNRRLAPDTYLEVVEIFEDKDGRVALESGEQIIEYAVKMKKLPRDRMLKELMSHGSVPPAVMDKIARKLADFHANAETGGEVDEIGGIDTIRRNHEDNFNETKPFIDATLPAGQYHFITSYVREFMKRNELLFHKRVAEHKIRNCHGDLHLEHICVMDSDIVIFDCIEFEKRFRYNDVAAEVAFLVMDLESNGYDDYGETFVNAYIQYSKDIELRSLLNFYKCYYAYVRGKVTSLKFGNSAMSPQERDETAKLAARYFDLAYTCAARLEKPTLILMAGLMGTGKSKLAQRIAPRLGAFIVQMDAVRKSLLNLSETDHHYEAFANGIYSPEVTRRTYAKSIETAEEKLNEGKSVIIDASFKNRDERKSAADMAKKVGSDFLVIECVCPDDIIKQRLEARLSDEREPSDGRWEIFQSQKDSFEPIEEFSQQTHKIIDTSLTLEETARRTIKAAKNLPSQ